MSDVFVTHRSTGETRCWDHYQIAGRGIPDDWREATSEEITAFRQVRSAEERIAALERRVALLERRPGCLCQPEQ